MKTASAERSHSEVTKVLENWIQHNKEHPYLNKSDLVYLNELTGLSHKQLRTWCTNYR